MQKRLEVKAEQRQDMRKQLSKLRASGQLPGVVYGKKLKGINLTLDHKGFEKLYKEAGESTLVNLAVGSDKPRTVLIHDVQHDKVSDEIIHVDFYEVDMTQKITAKVKLVFIGESVAVKDMGGVLVKNISEVEVECLPADLPKEVAVDISKLNSFDESIKVSDLQFDREKVKIILKPEMVVAKVAEPRSEEELKELEEKPVEEAVETVEGVVKEEKQEGEEGQEGEKKEEPAKEELKKE